MVSSVLLQRCAVPFARSGERELCRPSVLGRPAASPSLGPPRVTAAPVPCGFQHPSSLTWLLSAPLLTYEDPRDLRRTHTGSRLHPRAHSLNLAKAVAPAYTRIPALCLVKPNPPPASALSQAPPARLLTVATQGLLALCFYSALNPHLSTPFHD